MDRNLVAVNFAPARARCSTASAGTTIDRPSGESCGRARNASVQRRSIVACKSALLAKRSNCLLAYELRWGFQSGTVAPILAVGLPFLAVLVMRLALMATSLALLYPNFAA